MVLHLIFLMLLLAAVAWLVCLGLVVRHDE
jgi:hypothetical protein